MNTDIDALFDRLFPICRSITGPGIRESLAILQDHIPLEIHSVATGTKVFDWTVPQEWNLRRATLTDHTGKICVDTDISNLHVLNFSEPFKGDLTLEELSPHLHSDPAMPDAIPYVTSYYNERWGFCLTENQRNALKPGVYHANIATQKADGHLNYGVCNLPGETSETVLLTSYLCHPSMANNELSGPLALVGLYEKLAALPRRRYSYKFAIFPETIGSLVFLSDQRETLEPNLKAAMVLTCLGGPNEAISFKLSRRDWLGAPSEMDDIARKLSVSDPKQFSIRDFTPTGGSDERQFCSPGINWPCIQAAKTMYGDYPEYHTSKDDKSWMKVSSVRRSIDQLFQFLSVFEIADLKVASNILGGEPQLGRRGLYPTINGPMTNKMSADNVTDQREMLNQLLSMLSLSDGSVALPQMASKIDAPMLDLLPILQTLLDKNVVSLKKGSVA